MSRLVILLYFSIACSLNSLGATGDTLHSVYVKDDFVITVKKPGIYSPQKKYFHIYITDGSIGTGDYILGKSESWKATVPSNCIIIAISHIGNWHDKRPRDFIPSDISN